MLEGILVHNHKLMDPTRRPFWSGGFQYFMKVFCVLVALLAEQSLASTDFVPQVFNSPKRIKIDGGKTFIRVPVSRTLTNTINKGDKSLYVVFQDASTSVKYLMANKIVSDSNHGKVQGLQGSYTTDHPHVVVLTRNSLLWKDIENKGEFFINLSAGSSIYTMISVYYSETVQLELGSRYHVQLQGQETFKYTVHVDRKDKPQHHYKFLVTAKTYSGDAPTLSGYGVKSGSKDLSPQSHDYLLDKYDRQRVGIVFDKQSHSYCLTPNCEYKNAILTQGVTDLEVYNAAAIDTEVMTIGQNTIGHIKTNSTFKEDLFAFRLEDRNSTIITLVPIQGNAQLLVHPVSVPAQNSLFMYKADGLVGQRIVVSAFDMLGMSLPPKDAVLAVKVVCPSSCKYLLKTQTQTEEIFDLTPGFTEAGTGHPGEIKQYIIAKSGQQFSSSTIKQSFFLKLQLASGDANLHAMVCQGSQNCQFTKDALNKTETGVFHVLSKTPIKELKIPLVCGTSRPANIEAGVFYSESCAVVVAIETIPGNTSTISRYEITVDEEEIPSVLNMNHQSYIRLLPQQSKKFVLNYHSSASKQLDLAFIVDAKYGSFDCEVTPMSTPNKMQIIKIGSSHGMISESYRRILFRVPANGLTETYNVVVKTAQNSAGLILGVSEVEEVTGPLVSRELKAGVPVTDHIHSESRINYYSFKMSHNRGQDYETLKIKLNPIRGKFGLVLRNDDSRPNLEYYQWISYTDEITITKDDPAFNSESFYVLGVVDLSGVDKSTLHPLFQIQWTTTDKATMLLPGVFDSGALISTSQCFVAEIDSSVNQLLVLKGGREDISLYLLFGDTHKTPSPENHVASCLPESSGIYLKREDILPHCEHSFGTLHHCSAFICVYGEKDAKYSLGYTINHQPLVLPAAKVVHGPIPVGNDVLRFVYHPSKDQSVDIEEFGMAMFTTISTKVVEANPQNNYEWPVAPTNMVRVQSISNLVHLSMSDLSQFSNPLVLITLARNPAITLNQQMGFNTHLAFSLEAGMELKELIRDVPRSGRGNAGEIRYFHFYSHNPNEPVVVTADSLNRADLDIFVSRGKDSRPTADNNLVRSTIYGSSYVQILPQNLKAKGYSDFTGYYVVGIKATSNLEFTIRWSYLKNQIVAVTPNTATTVYLDSERSALVKGYSQRQKNLEILVDAHHSPVTLLWTCIPNTYTVKSKNDLEVFPTLTNFKKKFDISPASVVRVIKIPRSEMGECDSTESFINYFRLVTESENQVQVEFKLMMQAAWSLETLNLNSRSIGSAEPEQDSKYSFSLELDSEDELKHHFLEIEMFDGSATVVLKDKAFSFSAADIITAISSKDVPVGISTVSLSGIKGRRIDIPFIRLGLGNTMPRYYYSGGIDVKCPISICSFRLTLRKADWMAPLEVNTPREAYMPQQGSGESFVYACTGKEKKFDVSLVIENIGHPKINQLTEAQLKSIVQVFHVKRKEDLRATLTTTLESNVTHLDTLNGRYGLEYNPTVGYFVIRLNSLKEFGFGYRIEVNTEHYSRLIQGRQFMGLIDESHDYKMYEFVPYRSDAVFAKMSTCFGNFEVTAFNHNLTASKRLSQLSSVPRFVEILSGGIQGEPIYLKFQKTTEQQLFKNKFGYFDDSKNMSMFSLEVFESTAWSRVPFSDIRPFDEDMSVDLSANPPVLRFRPIQVPKEAYIKYKVVYYVVVSKDPDVMNYYLNCDKAYLNKLLKPEYTEAEVVQVYVSEPNLELNYETTVLKPYHLMSIPVTSGHRYYLSVYAQLDIELEDKIPEKFTSNRLRVVYNSIEFEYHSFFYPVELIAATLGLIGIIVASCCVVNTRWIRFFSKKISGFQGVEHHEVDRDLEEYFMRIKDDYQKEENKTRQKKKKRASNHNSPNTSGDSGLDTSSRLDESIVEAPADKPEIELQQQPATKTDKPGDSQTAAVPHEVEMV